MNTLITPLVVILSILLPQPRTGIDIIGQWQDAEAHEAEAHIRLQFHPNRAFEITIGIYFAGTYEVRGNDILVKTSNSDPATADKFSFKVEGDTMTLSATGEEMKFKRSRPSAPGDSPFVGSWGDKGAFFHGGNNGLCEVVLARNGRITFKLEREPERGRYKIKGRLLTMDRESYRVRFENGLLILKPLDETEPERKYKRMRKV